MKVLIAEDDSTSAIVLRKALEKLGHDAVVATDGDQAYALLCRDTESIYRIVISDWMMPGMDGLELTRRLRSERKPGDPYRFVILLTARGRPEDRRAGLEAGADDFMVKPLDMGDLIPRLSIAERMLTLEDRLTNQGSVGTLSPSINSEQTAPEPKSELVTISETSEPQDGENTAGNLLLRMVQDYDASEVHFEPLFDRTYQIRVRTADGSLILANSDADIDEVVRYLAAQVQNESLRFSFQDLNILANVAVLHTSSGDRVRVSLISSRLLNATETISDLPMREDVRNTLNALLEADRNTGGIVFVTAAKRDRWLKNRTLNAMRVTLSNTDTIVLDDLNASKLSDVVAQHPDVVVSYDFKTGIGDGTLTNASRINGILILTATDARMATMPRFFPTLLAVLSIHPLARDGSNAQDRYEIVLPEK